MSALLRPGDGRAGLLFSDAALLTAMVEVEAAWSAALGSSGIAPSPSIDLTELVGPDDVEEVAAGAEDGGNPVIPLVRLLRTRLAERDEPAARWLHRGLTSQDVLDTALMLCARAVADRLLDEIRAQVTAARALLTAHGDAIMAGRTLTQHAVPITFGLKVATWLAGVLDAADDLDRVRHELPAQVGGAAGSAAAAAELARLAPDTGDPATAAVRLGADLAARLGLAARPPWHTDRRPVTRLGDTLVAGTDAWGRIANDVLVLSRPEIGELREGRGGGSSTMPHKHNPVLSVLIRQAALSAPLLGAQLHLAAATAVDERPSGPWQAEWPALQALSRLAVVAAAQTGELLSGLEVRPEVMRARVEAGRSDLLAERDAVRASVGAAAAAPGDGPEQYLGASSQFVAAILDRADRTEYLRESR